YISVFFFLNEIFVKFDYKCPYRTLEKGTLILKHNDGQMFLDMKIENKISEYDCMVLDGGYYYYVENFINNCQKYGNDSIGKDNFMYPIRKEKNTELNEKEKSYNEVLGSFRSSIENNFGKFGNKFLRFNNNERATKITDIRVYNLQIKLSLLLMNIQTFCLLHNINTQSIHILWTNLNFDFPDPNRKKQIDTVYDIDF
ncbi:uncharacterized protein B0P05DRAFT_456045, partial [Gilbertella persicaria]|uniref:uncharacterized protein n=1 Tax=Gilbertella persicaria TaxID=101096 RepID=UPI0022202123